MEVETVRRVKNDTRFNVDIPKQWIPYWNGLLHVIGNVENGVIIRRYDWDKIIQDCEQFEAKYMNTNGFCESCIFYDMPAFLQERLRQKPPGMDCKMFAQDNDILFHYCMEKTQKTAHVLRPITFAVYIIITLLIIGLLIYIILFQR
jgi:hypothetical protein